MKNSSIRYFVKIFAQVIGIPYREFFITFSSVYGMDPHPHEDTDGNPSPNCASAFSALLQDLL